MIIFNLIVLSSNLNWIRWDYLTFFSFPFFSLLLFCPLKISLLKNRLLFASACAPLQSTPLTIVWARLLSLSSQSCGGSCHQPCMSLPAFSRCVGADGMAASQAQLQHQICSLSIMPNYGKETNAVYMLSLLGQRLDEKCHTLSLPRWHTLDALTVS